MKEDSVGENKIEIIENNLIMTETLKEGNKVKFKVEIIVIMGILEKC